MGDDDHRGGQGSEGLGQFAARHRIEIGRRLVKYQDLRFTGQNRGQRRPPTLTTGEMRGAAVGVFGHRHDFQRGVNPLGQRVTSDAEVRRAECDVLCDGRHEQLVVGILEHHPDPPSDVAQILAAQRHSADLDSAGTRGQYAVEMQHEGGLARPVGPEDGDPLTGRNVQIDTIECDPAVGIVVTQVLDPNGGRVHRSTQADPLTSTAATAGVSAANHCGAVARGPAPTIANSGTVPSKPRDVIAR